METSDQSRRPMLAVVVGAATLIGCSSEFPIAAVSGTVTLNGAPLDNASVYFQPQRKGKDMIVGPPSIGLTDEQGHFRLATHDDGAGAVVGPHVVSISTFESRMVDPENSDRVEVISREIVPPQYRAPSELRFEVPTSGTDEANFDLISN